MMDIETIRSHHEDMQFQQEYNEWVIQCEDTHRYIIWYRNGEYLAYRYVASTVDGGAIGLMPGCREEIGFTDAYITAIVDFRTRSFAYAQAIMEWIEDDEYLSIPY